MNTEGRVQLGRRAVFPPGEAREDWAILRALSDVLGKTLPYDNRAALRARHRQGRRRTSPTLDAAPVHADTAAATWGGIGESGRWIDAPFAAAIADFYLTNPIARASETMAEVRQALVRGASKTGGGVGRWR